MKLVPYSLVTQRVSGVLVMHKKGTTECAVYCTRAIKSQVILIILIAHVHLLYSPHIRKMKGGEVTNSFGDNSVTILC